VSHLACLSSPIHTPAHTHAQERAALGSLPLHAVAQVTVSPESVFLRNSLELAFQPDHLLKDGAAVSRGVGGGSGDLLWRLGVSERKGEVMVIYLALPSKDVLDALHAEVQASCSPAAGGGAHAATTAAAAAAAAAIGPPHAAGRKLPEPPSRGGAVAPASSSRPGPALQFHRALPLRRDVGGGGGVGAW
jgi:hypothetical protein